MDGGDVHSSDGLAPLLVVEACDTPAAAFAAALEAGVAPPIHLAGTESLVALYARALGAFGIPHRIHDPDAAALGLALIGGCLGDTDW